MEKRRLILFKNRIEAQIVDLTNQIKLFAGIILIEV